MSDPQTPGAQPPEHPEQRCRFAGAVARTQDSWTAVLEARIALADAENRFGIAQGWEAEALAELLAVIEDGAQS